MNKQYIIFDLDGTLIKSHKHSIYLLIDYIHKNYGIEKEEISYFFNQTRGFALIQQIEILLKVDIETATIISEKIYKLIREHDSTTFFEGVPETIKKLSKTYKLFLSTGNSTEFAEKKLTEAGIHDCFEQILGSDIFFKGAEHIDQFYSHGLDDTTGEQTVFVGDGQKDREIAKTFGFTFIHIDDALENIYNDIHEIDSVANIFPVLEIL